MSRIACFWIPHFIAEVARESGEPGLLLVTEGKRVMDASAETAAPGVRVGELASRALARCPDARAIPVDRVRCLEMWEQILDALALHSPVVEDARWGTAYLDAGGMAGLYGSETAWCGAVREEVGLVVQVKAQVGVAGSRFAAWVAAKSCEPETGHQEVEQPDRAFLAPCPVGELPLSEEALRRLSLLGIRTIGGFARLPATSVAEQFGPDALDAHRWARGADNRPLSGQRREALEVQLDFEVPEIAREPLLEAMLAASQGTLGRLDKGGLAVRRIALEARLAGGERWERAAWVGGALGKAKLHAVLEGLLAGLGGDEHGVASVCLKFAGLESRTGKQLNLFAHAEGRTRLQETLRRLVQKHSPGCVVRACVRSPDALLLRDRYGLEDVEP